MPTIVRHLTLLGLLLNGTLGMAASYLLKEPLVQVPASATVEKPDRVKIVAGRLAPAKAVMLEGGSLNWLLKDVREETLIELWLKPEKWDARSSGAVPLLSFVVGQDRYRLEKAPNQAELQLV